MAENEHLQAELRQAKAEHRKTEELLKQQLYQAQVQMTETLNSMAQQKHMYEVMFSALQQEAQNSPVKQSRREGSPLKEESFTKVFDQFKSRNNDLETNLSAANAEMGKLKLQN